MMADTEAEPPAFFGSGLKRWKGMEQHMPFSAEIDAQVTPVQTASGCIKYTKPKGPMYVS